MIVDTESGTRISAANYLETAIGHPAQLNFGDCFAYALAIESDEPLLYKGEDFRHTGIRAGRPD